MRAIIVSRAVTAVAELSSPAAAEVPLEFSLSELEAAGSEAMSSESEVVRLVVSLSMCFWAVLKVLR